MGSTIAWTFNERGVRNIYVADGPAFEPRRLTPYREDDGQELTQLAFSRDGATIVYVRGGDHGSNRQARRRRIRPAARFSRRCRSGRSRWPAARRDSSATATSPAIAPDSERVAFVTEPADLGRADRRLEAGAAGVLRARHERIARVVARRADARVRVEPGRSQLHRVVHDGRSRFVSSRRRPPATRCPPGRPTDDRSRSCASPAPAAPPRAPLARLETPPWSIHGRGRPRRPATCRSSTARHERRRARRSHPAKSGRDRACGGRPTNALVFMSYRDGFPHLYSIQHPGRADKSGQPTAAHAGAVHGRAGHADARSAVRHLQREHRAAIATTSIGVISSRCRSTRPRRRRSRPERASNGVPSSPPMARPWRFSGRTRSGRRRRPSCRSRADAARGRARTSCRRIFRRRSSSRRSWWRFARATASRRTDSCSSRGRSGQPARKPAVVYIHGGGPRQMLLGWHYRWEYANDYGANQYLASRGFIVLSVDYRLSVGYGQAFQFAENTGRARRGRISRHPRGRPISAGARRTWIPPASASGARRSAAT